MATSLSKKLKIQNGDVLLTINAPTEFEQDIDGLPGNVSVGPNEKGFTQIHWFVATQLQLHKELNKVLKLLKPGIICWIYYPKGTSKIQTDLTRDKGWDELLKHDELQWLSLVSFNETWSAFAMRLKSDADKTKAEKPKERIIFDYVDPNTKTIRLPDDIVAAFKKNKKEEAFFNTLSFTNKKEYIEWIVTAKREETRKERVTGTIERLAKKWKNPSNN